MSIYCGIDGTDNFDRTPLDERVSSPIQLTSFVKRISLLGFTTHRYFAGPTKSITGGDTDNIAGEAFRWINWCRHQSSKPKKVFLGGFSRGGAAAIHIAYLLKQEGVTIDGLFLFDAVDRTWSIPNGNSEVVPNNVIRTYHAARSDESESRPEFSNCGLRAMGPNFTLQRFKCTHGGMGGWRFGGGPNVTALSSGLAFQPVTHAGSTIPYRFTERHIVEPRPGPFDNHTAVSPLVELSSSLAVWKWMESKVIAAKNGPGGLDLFRSNMA